VNVRGQERCLTLLGRADRAADALEGLAHNEVMARRGRVFKSCRLVGLGNRGQSAGGVFPPSTRKSVAALAPISVAASRSFFAPRFSRTSAPRLSNEREDIFTS
jgi:hypothetical protein